MRLGLRVSVLLPLATHENNWATVPLGAMYVRRMYTCVYVCIYVCMGV